MDDTESQFLSLTPNLQQSVQRDPTSLKGSNLSSRNLPIKRTVHSAQAMNT